MCGPLAMIPAQLTRASIWATHNEQVSLRPLLVRFRLLLPVTL